MQKLAYQLGRCTALTKLGQLPPGTLVYAWQKGQDMNVDFVSPENLKRYQAQRPHAHQIDPAMLGLSYKTGSSRVLVTDEQTPQDESYTATDAALQERNVDDIWNQHDKRQQLFTRPPWPD